MKVRQRVRWRGVTGGSLCQLCSILADRKGAANGSVLTKTHRYVLHRALACWHADLWHTTLY